MSVSSSPKRFTFQKTGYMKLCEETGEDPNRDYLDHFLKVIDDHKHRFDEPESRVNNLEYDLLTTDWILEKARNNDSYAQNLYAALCNNEFQRLDVFPILKDETWCCTWRYAGGIIADMQQKGDYIDWYCSGIRDITEDDKVNEILHANDYVSEGNVTEEVLEDLRRLGWLVKDVK